MPTVATHTYSGQKLEPYFRPDLAVLADVKFVPALGLLARGTLIGRVTASGLCKNYNDAAGDGSQTAIGILAFDINVDANGRVTYTATAGQSGDEWGITREAAPIYIRGIFKSSELTGLDAAALADLGRISIGTLADGVFHMS